MTKQKALSFIVFLLMANVVFGAFQLAQVRSGTAESDFYSNLSHFGQVLRLIKENYVDESDAEYEVLVQEALRSMLRSLDPHSDYLDRQRFNDLQSETQQQYGGVGIQIEAREGRIMVIAPIHGTPAEEAGILSGDQIIRVNDQSTETSTIEEIVSLLRGKPGTTVDMTIRRRDNGDELTFPLRREIIQVDSVVDPMFLDDDVAYLRIAQFGERTGREFAEAFAQLAEKKEPQSLILDLRNNPGGLLTAAVDVASLFFDRNEVVVYTEGRNPEKRHQLLSRTPRTIPDIPIVVLVNKGSASASEIVAGALRDTGRALIVGETTFGKGSVQSILPLRNGDALRLTTALYYTPAGISIHETGIIPDQEVILSTEEQTQLRLQRSRPELATDEEAFTERFGFAPILDRQLDAALAILRASTASAASESYQDLAMLRGDGKRKEASEEIEIAP